MSAQDAMTNDRDSSGGYLTGDESERLWDEEEEDAFASAQVDYDDEDDDRCSSLEDPIELVWARAYAVAASGAPEGADCLLMESSRSNGRRPGDASTRPSRSRCSPSRHGISPRS